MTKHHILNNYILICLFALQHIRTKQEMVERRRNTKYHTKLSEIKSEEREKVKQGIKKPFFLKKSAVKDIILEEK